MEDLPEHCYPLLEKLSRIAKSQCNSFLTDMTASWLCFEVASALEKTVELGKEVNVWSDVNPAVKDQLHLPQMDVGIDYIDVDCTFAGQAKLYQPGSYIKARDIDRTRFCAYRAYKSSKDQEIMKNG